MCGCMFCNFTGRTFICPFLSSPINAGVLAMLAGLVVVPLVSLVTKVRKPEEVEGMFECYNNRVVVKATDALSSGEEA